jgi:hypothetical protein
VDGLCGCAPLEADRLQDPVHGPSSRAGVTNRAAKTKGSGVELSYMLLCITYMKYYLPGETAEERTNCEGHGSVSIRGVSWKLS